MMRVVSWGAGVQSTTIALLVENGALPRPDLWIFADTGREPRSVYEHLGRWADRFKKNGMRLEIVRRPGPNLEEHVLGRAERGLKGISMPPMYVDRVERSGRMPVRRGCTADFKADVIDKHAKAWAMVPRGYKGPPMVEQWLGISTDERQREKVSTDAWRVFRHPLLDLGMSRQSCLDYMAALGEIAPRSACVFCPFHSDAEWRRLRDEEPEDFADAVAFEQRVHAAWDRHGLAGLKSRPTLHPSGLPLDKVPLDGPPSAGEDADWQSWDNECGGVCGV